jgi:Holliday junction resolvasome RuvABC DNA-binding subunit
VAAEALVALGYRRADADAAVARATASLDGPSEVAELIRLALTLAR